MYIVYLLYNDEYTLLYIIDDVRLIKIFQHTTTVYGTKIICFYIPTYIYNNQTLCFFSLFIICLF